MKNYSQNIQNPTLISKLVKGFIAILLSVILAFSCFSPKAIAYADSATSDNANQSNNIDSLISRKPSSLTVANNSLMGSSIIPDLKSPFVNPVQLVINQLYNKILGPAQKYADDEIGKTLNWIVGAEPEAKEDPNKNLKQLQDSIDEMGKTLKDCQKQTMDTLNEILEESARNQVITALTNAQILFDKTYGDTEISTIDENIKVYTNAKKTNNIPEMKLALKRIADVSGTKDIAPNSNAALTEAYKGLYKLSMEVGGCSRLDNLYDKILNSKSNADQVIGSFHSLYYPFIKLMDKINEYQVISLTALREHDRICEEKEKLAPDYNDTQIANRIQTFKNRTKGVIGNLENLNNRICNIPNLTLTTTLHNNTTKTLRYHSFADAWIDAMNDNVKSAKITLYSDFVYNGESKNYLGNDIKDENKNMKYDISTSMTQYGKDSDGFFKSGNLNVKPGKNIQLDLNSHVLANLTTDLPTITVSRDANLTLISSASEFDGCTTKGQVGSVKYENGSAGSVHNVMFSDKYNFKKFVITGNYATNLDNNCDEELTDLINNSNGQDNLSNPYCKFEYKTFENVPGKNRILAAIYSLGGTKDFEVCGCDFINITNTSQGNAAGIEVYSKDNLVKTNSGKVTDGCAAADIKDCTFVGCRAHTGAAVSSTKHINVVDSVFDGCTSEGRGGAVLKFQIEGDRNKTPDSKYDKEASCFTKCKFNNNSAGERGGAINMLGDVKINDSQFTNNTAIAGGAVYCDTRKSCNCFIYRKGWEYDYYGKVEATNCVFDNNHANKAGNAEKSGGAILLDKGFAVCNNCEFTNNFAGHDGGAVAQLWDHTYPKNFTSKFINTNFNNNACGHRGGACKNTRGATFEGVKMTNNRAENAGGGMYSELGGTDLKNITVTNNRCKTGRGAGVLVEYEVFLFSNVVVKDNFLESGERSDLRANDNCGEGISPEWGFDQGGSELNLDLKGVSNIITDKKTETNNKGWIKRINSAKRFMHMNDGRTVQTDTWGTWFWQKYWLKAA